MNNTDLMMLVMFGVGGYLVLSRRPSPVSGGGVASLGQAATRDGLMNSTNPAGQPPVYYPTLPRPVGQPPVKTTATNPTNPAGQPPVYYPTLPRPVGQPPVNPTNPTNPTNPATGLISKLLGGVSSLLGGGTVAAPAISGAIAPAIGGGAVGPVISVETGAAPAVGPVAGVGLAAALAPLALVAGGTAALVGIGAPIARAISPSVEAAAQTIGGFLEKIGPAREGPQFDRLVAEEKAREDAVKHARDLKAGQAIARVQKALPALLTANRNAVQLQTPQAAQKFKRAQQQVQSLIKVAITEYNKASLEQLSLPRLEQLRNDSRNAWRKQHSPDTKRTALLIQEVLYDRYRRNQRRRQPAGYRPVDPRYRPVRWR